MTLGREAAGRQGLMELGDRRVVYQEGAARMSSMVWRPTGGFARARHSIRSLGGSSSSLAADGPWAWFRLIDKGSIQKTSTQDRFRVKFSIKGLSASYEIRAGSVINPFLNQELRMMGCPESL